MQIYAESVQNPALHYPSHVTSFFTILLFLSAIDCFELGRIAYLQQDYYHTLIWMQEALDRLYKEEQPTADEAEILEHLGFSMYHQGNVKRALELTKRLYEIG